MSINKTKETIKDDIVEKSSSQPSTLRSIFDLLFCIVSIYSCYLYYGIIQESIYKVTYKSSLDNGIELEKKFKFPILVLVVQSILGAVVALVGILITRESMFSVPIYKYIIPSGSYIGAMFASNKALLYVSFPTQVLAKCCKMIPVMLMRIIINKKRYKKLEYLCVVLITTGVCLFRYFESTGKKKQKEISSDDNLYGILFLLLSLTLDGITGPIQEKLRDQYKKKMGKFQMMFWLNIISAFILISTDILSGKNDIQKALEFTQTFPDIVQHILKFGILSGVGQVCIFITLFRFDSLVLTTITTTRKFFAVLLSIVLYGHYLNSTQWLSFGLVAGGLGLQLYSKYQSKKEKEKKKKEKEE